MSPVVAARVEEVSAQALKVELADGREIALLDVREQGQYGQGHPFLAVPLPYSRLELDAGHLLPCLTVRVVVLDDEGGNGADALAQRAARRLQALGYRHVRVLQGGARGWALAGYTLYQGVHLPSKTFGELIEHHCHTPSISADQLQAMLQAGDNVQVLDGRSRSEYQKMTIPGATSCPNAELGYRLHRLAPDAQTTVVVNCAGRTRSIMGAQSLINLGVPNRVLALENGTQGWYLRDFALEHGSQRFYPEVSAADPALQARREQAQGLAVRTGVQPVSWAQLASWQDDSARSSYFFDIRTPEEFKHGPAYGALPAEGGQLLQGTDLYIAVRHARVVLLDTDGIRAPLVGSWLVQMGFEVFLLDASVWPSPPGQAQPAWRWPALPQPAAVTLLTASQLRELQEQAGAVHVIDLRLSLRFRSLHLRGAVWSTRALVRQTAHQLASAGAADSPLVLVASDAGVAALAASELAADGRTIYCTLDAAAWAAAGLATESSPQQPPDADCIDYLFFVHDRHDGNKQAARQYLAWEMNLVSQLDAQERAVFELRP